MSTTIQKYQNLEHFLCSNKRKDGGKFTHTRLSNKKLKIFGGSYNIPTELMEQFWKLYYDKIWKRKEKEYLTEIQDRENGGPLLVDIDMRFGTDIKERVVSLSTISDIVELYGDALQDLFNFDKSTKIPVYVFQKDNIVPMENLTKDGLHFVFGIHMTHIYQQILRNIVIDKEENITQIFGEDGIRVY